MSSVLTSIIVNGVFVVITSAMGLFIRLTGKPYGVVRPIIHILLFLFIVAVASAYKLEGLDQSQTAATISLYLMGLTVLCNFVVGISMLFAKSLKQKFVSVHMLSTLVTAISPPILCVQPRESISPALLDRVGSRPCLR